MARHWISFTLFCLSTRIKGPLKYKKGHRPVFRHPHYQVLSVTAAVNGQRVTLRLNKFVMMLVCFVLSLF